MAFFNINVGHVDINLVLFIPTIYHVSFLRFRCNDRDQNGKRFSVKGLKRIKIKCRDSNENSLKI